MYSGLWAIMVGVALVHAPVIIWVHNSPRSFAKFMQGACVVLGVLSPLIGQALADLQMKELPQMYEDMKLMMAMMYTVAIALSGFSGHLLWHAVWRSYGFSGANETTAEMSDSMGGVVEAQVGTSDFECMVCGRDTSATLSRTRCVALHRSGFVCHETHGRESRNKSLCALCERRIGPFSEREFVAVYVDEHLYESAVHAGCYPAYASACEGVEFREKLMARFRA